MPEVMSGIDWQQRVHDLPALPQVVIELLQLMRNDRLPAERCVALISQEPALAARTLRLANSAFYGVPGRVSSIADAVSLLGLRTVSGALAVAALSGVLNARSGAGATLATHWRHAVATALCSRAVAQRVSLDPDLAFLAGLMHDLGKLVIDVYLPQVREPLRACRIANRSSGARSVNDCEHEVLGMDHAQIGAALARHWHFPPAIVQAIVDHHRPHCGQPLQLADVVCVANAVAHALDLCGDADESVPELDAVIWARIGLDEAGALALFAAVESGVEEICAALGF